MGFPSRREIKKMLKKLENVEGTLGLAENPTPLQRFRWEICQNFIIHKRTKDLTSKELANILGIDESKMSKILHHRIDEFSTDRLVDLYCKIDPKLKIMLG